LFGVGRKRKLYNGAVDTKLNNEYQIRTRDNPSFPGMIAYLQFIDNAWDANMSEDEAALYIATLYYDGISKTGSQTEASALHGRILSIVEFGRARGLISEKIAGAVLRDVEKISKRQVSGPTESLSGRVS
jgi:hypothetical protein